jgi:hypothetical protein
MNREKIIIAIAEIELRGNARRLIIKEQCKKVKS